MATRQVTPDSADRRSAMRGNSRCASPGLPQPAKFLLRLLQVPVNVREGAWWRELVKVPAEADLVADLRGSLVATLSGRTGRTRERSTRPRRPRAERSRTHGGPGPVRLRLLSFAPYWGPGWVRPREHRAKGPGSCGRHRLPREARTSSIRRLVADQSSRGLRPSALSIACTSSRSSGYASRKRSFLDASSRAQPQRTLDRDADIAQSSLRTIFDRFPGLKAR